jgi:long-chain fatty acid transport protein
MSTMRNRTAAAAAVVLVAAAADAHAAGFGLYEQGARALGTAGAFTARADDPSAIFFNPAGIAQLDAKQLVLSPNVIYYKSEFSGVAPNPGYGVEEETKGEYFPPFAAYYAQGIDKKVAAGVGVYSPYGLQVAWKDPDTFTGRAISTLSKITPFYIVPSAAWAPSPSFRVGAGATIVLSKVELQRHLQAYNPIDDRTDDIGMVAIASNTSSGVGFNAGVQWWPGDARWKLGATYRSQVRIDYAGTADFSQLATGNDAFDAIVAAGFPPDQRADTHIEFPAQASLGVGRQFSPAWYGEVNFNWTEWSSFDRLDLTFSQSPSRNLSIVESWDDAFNIRTGLEYRKGGTADWAWRAGYYFDQSPQPAEGVGPLLPDSDRHGITGGAGWRDGKGTTVDAFFLGVLANERSTEGVNRDGYDGTYQSGSWSAGVSLGLTFR